MPEEALDDPDVTVNLKYRIQKYLDSQKLIVKGELIQRGRIQFERSVLENYCRDEMALEEYIEIYNAVLRKNNVPEDDGFYYTESNKRSRSNNLSKLRYVIWKNDTRLRYYDTARRDFTILLETINLGQFRNVEISADLFMMNYPELMQEYDIRDCQELHSILKTIVDPRDCQEISFPRQPTIRFGTFDRKQIIKEHIEELSPVSRENLVEEIHKRYGFQDTYILWNILTDFSNLFHNGFYSVEYNRIPNKHLGPFCAALTEDYYSFEELQRIYSNLFPGSDLQNINPRMLKTMGFEVYSAYVIRNYRSADEFFVSILTKDDIFELEPLRKRFVASYNA